MGRSKQPGTNSRKRRVFYPQSGTSKKSVKYEEKIEHQPYASALLAEGRIYIVTRFNGTMVLDAKPQFKQLALNELADKSMTNASPIVANGSLIMRTDQNLYCIKKSN